MQEAVSGPVIDSLFAAGGEAVSGGNPVDGLIGVAAILGTGVALYFIWEVGLKYVGRLVGMVRANKAKASASDQ